MLAQRDGIHRRSAKVEGGHQSRVAPARGLPSEALAKGGGKAERVSLLHSGSCSWHALLPFSGGLPPGRRSPILCRWVPPRHPLRRRLGALMLSLRLIGPAVDHQSRPALGDFPLLVGLRGGLAGSPSEYWGGSRYGRRGVRYEASGTQALSFNFKCPQQCRGEKAHSSHGTHRC